MREMNRFWTAHIDGFKHSGELVYARAYAEHLMAVDRFQRNLRSIEKNEAKTGFYSLEQSTVDSSAYIEAKRQIEEAILHGVIFDLGVIDPETVENWAWRAESNPLKNLPWNEKHAILLMNTIDDDVSGTGLVVHVLSKFRKAEVKITEACYIPESGRFKLSGSMEVGLPLGFSDSNDYIALSETSISPNPSKAHYPALMGAAYVMAMTGFGELGPTLNDSRM